MRVYTHLIDVVPHEKRWNILIHRTDSTVLLIASFRIKRTAVAFARNMGNTIADEQGRNLRLELQVRGKDGRILQKDSYGTDPRSVKG